MVFWKVSKIDLFLSDGPSNKNANSIVLALGAACKACVPKRIYVTDLCQGCVARPCKSTCKFGATV